jgi:spermidine/putrescine transport system substrate-binding protein
MRRGLDKLYYRLKDGELSRREMHAILAAGGFTFAAMNFGGNRAVAQDSCGEGSPTFFIWSGYELPEFYPEYMEKHGCLPNFSMFGDEEEAFAKMRAGFAPDVMQPCSYKVKQWFDAGLLAEIDTSRLGHWDELIPALADMPVGVQDGKRVFVPTDWGLTSVTFRTDLAPEYVDNNTWGILWDEKYSGRLSMIDSLIDGVAVAGIYKGVPNPFDLSNPEDMETVRAALQEQLPLLRFYSNSMTDVENALASGELIAAATWNSSWVALKDQGLDVQFMTPKEGPMTWVCGVVRNPANDSQTDEVIALAYEVIDNIISPQAGAWEIENYGYGHSNAEAFAIVGPEKLAELGLPADPGPYLAAGIFQEAMVPEDKIQTMFEEVKAGM